VTRPLPRPAAPLAALCLAVLAGCPLPQSLPEFPSTGAITPPRIVADAVTPFDTVTEVEPDCGGEDASHVFTLTASLIDENTTEKVEARWFVDYQPGRSTETPIPPIQIIEGDGATPTRPLAEFQFRPYTFDSPAFRLGGGLHVVELVVSNGFAPEPGAGDPPLARPWRTPASTPAPFETQVYRWIFHYVPGGRCGTP
jgi:hypothetical protein